MAKEKIRCARCHKQFRGSAKDTLCPACQQLDRQARAAAKASAAGSATQARPTVAPRIMGAGAGILDPRFAAAASAPTTVPTAPASHPERHDDHEHRHDRHDDGHGQSSLHTPHDGEARQHPPHAKDKRPANAPKLAHQSRPKLAPKPPTPPFVLTDEMRAQVEARYLELAKPVEFDGIRTQIATELGIPKVAAKRAVRELRARMQLPSWWELQAYEGTPEALERIRAAYTPLLPLPDVGVHVRLASELGLDSRMVYQGIRRIRAEMRLPQYNPPEAHGLPPAKPTAPEAISVQTPEATPGADASL